MEDKITEKVYCYDHPSAYNNHDIKMGYEQQLATCNQTNTLQNSIQYVATGVERGFSALGFQNA